MFMLGTFIANNEPHRPLAYQLPRIELLTVRVGENTHIVAITFK